MWYQIKALNPGSSFMCIFGNFIGCHGNGSQELIKNRGRVSTIFIKYLSETIFNVNEHGIDKDMTIYNVCDAKSTLICTYIYLCTSSY